VTEVTTQEDQRPDTVLPDDVVDGPKLIRLQRAIGSLLDEMHGLDRDRDEQVQLVKLVPRILAEVGSSLPNELLAELGLLVGPVPEDLTADGARVILAQVEGWVGALAAEALAAVRAGQIVSTLTA
jgi:hypothetical protein